MTHTEEHVFLLLGIAAFGLFLVWLAHRLLRDSESPRDVAQRELDRKKR